MANERKSRWQGLVHDPRNILLDEPTNGLDVMSTRAVRDLIRRLRADGRCVLFSSPRDARGVCAVQPDYRHRARKNRRVRHARRAAAQTGHDSLEDAFVTLAGFEQDTEAAV